MSTFTKKYRCEGKNLIEQTALLRRYIRNHLLEEKTPSLAISLKDSVWNLLQQLSQSYEFEPEILSPSTYAARFNSSRKRDDKMKSLIDEITVFVEANYPDPRPKIETVGMSAHSREVLRLSSGKEKLTIAFKAPSTGQAGIDFETVLFAVLKDDLGVFNMTSSEKSRVADAFGIDKSDPKFYSVISSMLKSPPDELVDLVNRAKSSASKIGGTFSDVTNVKMKGGQGGKGDIELETKSGGVDLSLKHEKKHGTNVYEFNKDLGDGTREIKVGRDPSFTYNFIPSGDKPWWQIARQRIVDAINRAEKDPQKKFKSGLSSREKDDFIKNPAAKSSMKVNAVVNELGGDAKAAASKTLREAFEQFVISLKSMSGEQLISLINEAKLGSSGINPVYKLTSSPTGDVLRQVKGVTLSPDDAKSEVIIDGSNVTVNIVDLNKNIVGALVIRGLKFRNGVFSTTKSDLSVKTRA